MKDIKEKSKYRLIYTSMMDEISKIREMGARKYGDPESWKTTLPIDHIEAAERHIRQFMDGEIYDKESGYTHAAHAICNLMFEIERLKILGKEYDIHRFKLQNYDKELKDKEKYF
ncbi:MAG: DUF5664 domain-containing protein [Candidatus Lokiarchaeota archaeon]